MKKLISLILCITIVVCVLPCHAQALDDGMSSASIGVIKHFQAPTPELDHSDKPLEITVTVPKTYDGATVMAAFYTDGIMTKLMPMEISSSTLKGTIKFYMTSGKDGDNLPPTPDSIKLFTWNQNNLKPLANSHEILTTETVEDTNYQIVSYVLEYIIGTSSKKSITQYTRDNANYETEHDKIDALLTKMDECAQVAYESKSSQLLTSEYARRMFYDDVIQAFNILEADQVQKNEFIRIYNSMNNGYWTTVKKTFDRLANLLCVDISGFVNQN